MKQPDSPTLIATYPSRRDAEMASDRLEQEGIRTIVTADDAGGMHPEMQMAHSVKLQVRQDQADEAHTLLQNENMLAGAHDDAESAPAGGPPIWRDLGAAFFIMGGVAFAVGLLTEHSGVMIGGGIVAVLGGVVWTARFFTNTKSVETPQ